MMEIDENIIDLQGKEMDYISFKELIEQISGVEFKEIYKEWDEANGQKNNVE